MLERYDWKKIFTAPGRITRQIFMDTTNSMEAENMVRRRVTDGSSTIDRLFTTMGITSLRGMNTVFRWLIASILLVILRLNLDATDTSAFTANILGLVFLLAPIKTLILSSIVGDPTMHLPAVSGAQEAFSENKGLLGVITVVLTVAHALGAFLAW